MRSIVFVVLAFVLISACRGDDGDHTIPPAPLLGSPYVARAQSISCSGNMTARIVPPGFGPQTVIPTSVTYYNDVAGQQFAFSLGALGTQYTFANGSYQYQFNPQLNQFTCTYFSNHTYAFEPLAKSTILLEKVSDHYLTYNGLGRDAAAGFSDMSAYFVVNRRTGITEALGYSQNLPLPKNGQPCPTLLLKAKSAGDIALSSCVLNVPAPSNFQLPAICYGPFVPNLLDVVCI